MSRIAPAALLLSLALVPGLAGQGGEEEEAVSRVLDALHEAAADGAYEAYFDLYADGAIFLGTDATERWTKAEFMAYAQEPFADGHGWTYVPLERHVTVAPGAEVAWFDERLENANLGETRGSGVLVREAGEWKVAQYNLTIPIPNEIAREVVARIRACCVEP
ncbi:MAG: nuclear transport factor 2 family protein [Gemmatimonadota bacterium]|nr:nuclear transport factor 2 family protein [Gemmatimonadota bacterium]